MLATCSVGYSSLVGYEDDDRVLRGPRSAGCAVLIVGGCRQLRVVPSWRMCVYRACMCVGLRPGSKRFGPRRRCDEVNWIRSIDVRSARRFVWRPSQASQKARSHLRMGAYSRQAENAAARARHDPCWPRALSSIGKQNNTTAAAAYLQQKLTGRAQLLIMLAVMWRNAAVTFSAKRFYFVAFVCFPKQGITCCVEWLAPHAEHHSSNPVRPRPPKRTAASKCPCHPSSTPTHGTHVAH